MINKENLQYAGFGTRFKASIIDTVLYLLIILPILYLIYGSEFFIKLDETNVANSILQYAFPFVATLLFWIYKSATPGKIFIKAKIVDATTFEKPSTKQFIIRNFAYYLSLLPLGLGYFWIIWDKKKQGWHDKLANTLVLQPKKETKSIGFGGYVLRGLAVFFALLFGAFLVFGLLIEFKLLPDGNIYKEENLKQSVKQELVDKKILTSGDNLHYLQVDSVFSFTGEGILISEKAITLFSTNEADEVNSEVFNFSEIESLVVTSFDDLNISDMTTYEDTFDFKLLVIYIYGADDTLLESPVLSVNPNEVISFKEDILRLWGKAREE